MTPIEEVVARADGLRDRGFFADAALVYRQAVMLDPKRVDLLVQLGNMLKDAGDVVGAVEVYSGALQRKPGDPDVYLQLGRACRLAEDRPAALRAFAAGLQLEPGHKDLLRELVTLGEGWQAGRRADMGDRLLTGVVQLANDMRHTLRAIEAHLPLISSLVRLPPEGHDLWRHTRRAPPPPQPAIDFQLAVVMRGDAPLKEMLAVFAALGTQTHKNFSVVMPDLQGESLNALIRLVHVMPERYFLPGLQDALITDILDGMSFHDGVVYARAPMILEPEALAWIASALEAGARSIYLDEDVVELEGGILRYREPHLYAECDLELLEQGFARGLVLAARADAFMSALANAGKHPDPATLSLALLKEGEARTLREVFASRPAGARPHLTSAITPIPQIKSPAEVLTVMIPTRDQWDLLAQCLDALRRTARNLASVQVLILDNGSKEIKTLNALEEGLAAGRFLVERFDEPFNWSRLNRLGTMMSDGSNLLFLNNDVEIVTEGWDEIINELLARPEVGAIGAKLLYPNRNVQHAGMYIATPGRLEHVGRGAPASAAGPMHLYERRRCSTAVTGAFLATRRSTFNELGGFDEECLPVWHNDVDYCLKVWDVGLRVLYVPEILGIHRESVTIETILPSDPRECYREAAEMVLRQRWSSVLDRDRWVRL